jgi:hypothetical protein
MQLCCLKTSQLEDASNYITKLPKAEHTAVEWQVGAEGGEIAMPKPIGEPRTTEEDEGRESLVLREPLSPRSLTCSFEPSRPPRREQSLGHMRRLNCRSTSSPGRRSDW